MMIPGRIPRSGTLFREDATLGEAEQWIQDLHYKSVVDADSDEARTLDNLLKLVADQFLRHGAKIHHIDPDGVWLTDPAGQLVPLRDISEGYRSALAMLVDIYRHIVAVQGHDVVSVGSAGRYMVSSPGVVLIDEVDSHLHPEWQRDIGFWFKDHFPQIQFIVTSHSPLVCTAADGGRIYHLPQPGQGKPFQLSTDDFEKVCLLAESCG
jgi:hypothetical protein